MVVGKLDIVIMNTILTRLSTMSSVDDREISYRARNIKKSFEEEWSYMLREHRINRAILNNYNQKVNELFRLYRKRSGRYIS